MLSRGIATFTLDYGTCPRWLFERMVNLGRQMIFIIVEEYGPDEFIKRIADPVWFQSLGTVLAFDWNASGLTTILTAALKEALRGYESDLQLAICGGKGKTSRKTPEEIGQWGERINLPNTKVNSLVYNSKMAAKVDSALVQDGYQIYHHAFFFSQNGAWSVVQQGMNTVNQTARRYHWHSAKATDLVCEPHAGIISQRKNSTLNLSAQKSDRTRETSVNIIKQSYLEIMNDVRILRKHYSSLSGMISLHHPKGQLTLLNLANTEFAHHPVETEDFSKSTYLEKILHRVREQQPDNYEKLLSLEGVGPKTIRALSLVSELIYGAKPSYEDPARYSFAHGGKDATPYPIDRQTYDETIAFFKKAINKMKIAFFEKQRLVKKLETA